MAEYFVPSRSQVERPRVSGFRGFDQPLPLREHDMLFAGLLANNIDWFATCSWCLRPIVREPGRRWMHVYTGRQICRLAVPRNGPFRDAAPLNLDNGPTTVETVIHTLDAFLDRLNASASWTFEFRPPFRPQRRGVRARILARLRSSTAVAERTTTSSPSGCGQPATGPGNSGRER